MSDTLTKLTYQTFQQGKNYFGLAHKIISSQLLNLILLQLSERPHSPPELLLKLQRRLNQLLEADWQDAEQGVYPKSLLLIIPGQIFFRYYPVVWLDMPQIWSGLTKRNTKIFRQRLTAGYPSYYCKTSIIRRILVICQPISMTYRLKFSLVAQPIRCGGESSFLRRGLKVLIRFQRVKYGFSM